MPHDVPRTTRQAILASGRRIVGRKGFSSAGLHELLAEAGVPKGSFYHWFPSKDAFGEQMIEQFYADHLAGMDRLSAQVELPAGERLLRYFAGWRAAQLSDDTTSHCLTTKLGSEVSEDHPALRAALQRGGRGIIDRIERLVAEGVGDRSVRVAADPATTAQMLFDLWVGAGVRAKVSGSAEPLDHALAATGRLLGSDAGPAGVIAVDAATV